MAPFGKRVKKKKEPEAPPLPPPEPVKPAAKELAKPALATLAGARCQKLPSLGQFKSQRFALR
jgi:hypothetical protein